MKHTTFTVETLGDLIRTSSYLWLHCPCGHNCEVMLDAYPGHILIDDFRRRARCTHCRRRSPEIRMGHTKGRRTPETPDTMTVMERYAQIDALTRQRPKSFYNDILRDGRVLVVLETSETKRGLCHYYHASVFPDWWVRIDNGVLRMGEKVIWGCCDVTGYEMALAHQWIFGDVLKRLQSPGLI